MSIFYRLYCRVYQRIFKVASYFLNFREPKLLEGLDVLPKFIKDKGFGSVLIVTDDFLHNKAKLIDGLKAGLKEQDINVMVYDKVVPNPTISNIEEGVKCYNEGNCKAIIAVGGGSPMDCAKGIGARIARPNKSIPKMKGLLKVLKKIPTLFAIPTTSGTGSEATVTSVVSNETTHEKYPINDTVLIPSYAVLDPKLTIGLPKHITSTTGMDALTHAVEAYIGSSNTKKTAEMARKAVVLIFENLKKAYDNGEDLTARKNMQLAAFYAGIAFTRAYVGNVHAIAHTLGGFYNAPHGDANAVILPYILEYYGQKAYKKLAELADLVDIKGQTVEEKGKNFILAIRGLNQSMNIPDNVNEIKAIEKAGGVKDQDIPTMVERAFAEANPLYPVPKIMSKKDFTKMYYTIQKK
ncbi:MAG: iron-containing alcohol dehydrogenase [Clostridiales bacterium]|nr:iron-containing alcohol dehydrogenase [Clostridiales bacterium]